MKCGGFIPKEMYVDVADFLRMEKVDDYNWKSVYSEPRKKKVLFCDVMVHANGDIYIDKYYDENFAVSERITELELQALPGFETFREGESGAMFRKVFA